MRPGDVVRHYGGLTTEVRNTDAEGRLVLADALAYAARRLKPDVLVDLATLTGAQSVALGKRTAALFSDNDDAGRGADRRPATDAGEPMWRLPLHDDYLEPLAGDDRRPGQLHRDRRRRDHGRAVPARVRRRPAATAGRTSTCRRPRGSTSADGAADKGATGWGVRTLLRWLETQATATADHRPVPA